MGSVLAFGGQPGLQAGGNGDAKTHRCSSSGVSDVPLLPVAPASSLGCWQAFPVAKPPCLQPHGAGIHGNSGDACNLQPGRLCGRLRHATPSTLHPELPGARARGGAVTNNRKRMLSTQI